MHTRFSIRASKRQFQYILTPKVQRNYKTQSFFSVFYPFNYILVLRRMINSTTHFETVRGVMDNSIILNNIISICS